MLHHPGGILIVTGAVLNGMNVGAMVAGLRPEMPGCVLRRWVCHSDDSRSILVSMTFGEFDWELCERRHLRLEDCCVGRL
jgi:hypothetical protein